MIDKTKYLIFILVLTLFSSCSFDNKTGIWDGSEKEKKRISDIEWNQKNIKKIVKVYSSTNIFKEEVIPEKNIILSEPKKISSWSMANYNHQNFLGNIYISGIDNVFLKKKVGKDKFSISKLKTSPLIFKNSIIIVDDRGTIYNINKQGKINWKKNIYKKIYKKIYKNLTFAIYKQNIYIADNLGFIYAISLDSGEVIWIKNHGIPLKSKIKIYEGKIFLINQDNRILALNEKDGSVIWDIRSIESFIKSQNLLSLALPKNGYVIASTSSGDLIKANANNGDIAWSVNTLKTMLSHGTDFFKSSDIVISNDKIIFSTQHAIFSFNLSNGYMNWESEVSSVGTPIIDGENIFFVTENGFFIVMDINTGEIVLSKNILKILKERKRSTKITGFVMGSGKMYSVTLNGYLIINSALSGEVEDFEKIGSSINSTPIIADGRLFIYTKDSKILGLN
mgnify:CR=1 FL=1